jgi:Tfp pilus assembly protein PilV
MSTGRPVSFGRAIVYVLYDCGMPPRVPYRRNGFILAEAMVALLVIGIAFLALEGSLGLTTRSLADSERESIAARLAENQRERAFAANCAPASGSDSVNTVAVSWTASPIGALTRVAQTSRYRDRTGDRTEQYDALSACQ